MNFMKFERIRLENKPLCMTQYNDTIFIGDTFGKITKIKAPYKYAEQIPVDYNYPISSIFLTDENIFLTNWKGEILKLDHEGRIIKTKRFGDEMIKSSILYESKIYVSYECFVFVLTDNFELVEQFEMPYKVLCFKIFNDKLYCGLNNPYLSIIGESLWLTKHDTTIFSMTVLNGKLLTASADNTVRISGDEIIFRGSEWVRTIDGPIIGEGKNVRNLESAKIIYSHGLEVSDVIFNKGKIFSIGYDNMFVCFDENEEMVTTFEEDEEIERLLREMEDKK